MTTRRRARLGVGALMIAVPASAGALTAGQALAAPPAQPPEAGPESSHISYGHDVIVRGMTPAAAGHTLVLEFAPRGATGWSQLSSTTVGGDGRFRLAAQLRESGTVRTLDVSSGSLTPFVAGRGGRATASQASTQTPIDVAAALHVASRRTAVLGGQAVEVRGRIAPAVAGRRVALQGLANGAWRTLTSARTGAAGRFMLRYLTDRARRERIRVRFGGDRLNGRSTAALGEMTVYREAGASWYNDGGTTACGFHAVYGVANRTLPCGTTVSFRFGGRTVTATVDDRGPFVGGRDWDLNQNTASALGFGGVGIVWSSQ
jgi:rare lipoprotein A